MEKTKCRSWKLDYDYGYDYDFEFKVDGSTQYIIIEVCSRYFSWFLVFFLWFFLPLQYHNHQEHTTSLKGEPTSERVVSELPTILILSSSPPRCIMYVYVYTVVCTLYSAPYTLYIGLPRQNPRIHGSETTHKETVIKKIASLQNL